MSRRTIWILIAVAVAARDFAHARELLALLRAERAEGGSR